MINVVQFLNEEAVHAEIWLKVFKYKVMTGAFVRCGSKMLREKS